MPRLRSGRKVKSLDTKISENESNLEDPANNEVIEPEIGRKEEDSTVDDAASDSEDEAPESVPLITSKDAAIARRHDEKEAVDAMKEKEKQRRRDREETLKQQKEMRVNREKSRISDDILLKVTEKQEQVAKQQEIQKPNVHVTFDDDDDDDGDGDDSDKEDDSADKMGLQLVVLNQTKKRKPGVMDSASEFLKNHFYGDRLKRVDTMNDENRKRKKRNFGPSVKFVKTS